MSKTVQIGPKTEFNYLMEKNILNIKKLHTVIIDVIMTDIMLIDNYPYICILLIVITDYYCVIELK